MNKKQRILTVVALAVFGLVMIFHCGSTITPFVPAHSKEISIQPHIPGPKELITVKEPAKWPSLAGGPLFPNVRMPLFVLAVFYAGLFFILATPRGKQ